MPLCSAVARVLCFGRLHSVGSKFDIVDMLPLSLVGNYIADGENYLFFGKCSQHVNSKL